MRRPIALAVLFCSSILYAEPSAAPEPEPSVFRETVDHIWHDQKRMLTAPLRTNRNDLIVWGTAGAALLALTPSWGNRRPLDERIEENINRHGFSRHFLKDLTHVGDAPVLIGTSLAGYGLGYWQDMPRVKTASLHTFESLIDAGIVVEIAKVLAGRHRPINKPLSSKFNGPVGYFKTSDNDSFPSGHAAMTFAAATVISHESENTWVGLGAYGLAGTISYSRIYVEKHYASDLVAGAVLGYSIGVLVEKHRHAKDDDKAGRIAPTLIENAPGLAWTKKW